MTLSLKPQDLHANAKGTLELVAQNYFWTDGEWVQTLKGPMMKGQMYVEYWIPQDLRLKTPIVMIHGGGGQGLDYIGTPDGREGWAGCTILSALAMPFMLSTVQCMAARLTIHWHMASWTLCHPMA